jgi:CrcB protein
MAAPNIAASPPPLDRPLIACVVAGGMIGTFVRALLAASWTAGAAHWPWPTFTANLLGAALLGAVVASTARTSRWHSLLGTGVCGGLTTFSTMQLEVLRMLDVGATELAITYATASVVLGIAAATAAARLTSRRRANR